MKKSIHRIVFYSKSDGASYSNLQNAEQILNNFQPEEITSINDIIELYNIKLYLDNDLHLPSWTEIDKSAFKEKSEEFWNLIKQFFLQIDNSNFSGFLSKVDYQYLDSFWKLIETFQIYTRFDTELLEKLVENKRFTLRHLLRHRKIIEHFPLQAKQIIIGHKDAAELLLSYFEEHHSYDKPELYFPKVLKDSDKEEIILKYLERDDANLNYVRLAVKSRNLKLSDKTKLVAKKLAKKQNDEIIDEGTSTKFGVRVAISEKQQQPVKVKRDQNDISYTYSTDWLESQKSPLEIIGVFARLFKYMSDQGCINLVNKNFEVDGFERALMRSRNEYYISFKFQEKSMVAQAQFNIYMFFLKQRNINIEETLSEFINGYLNENFSINGIKITFASQPTTTLEKIRMLAPEMEFLLKQYESFAEEGQINFELLQFGSTPLNIGEVKSSVKQKYVYGDGDQFLRLKNDFFSSMLHYIEPFKNKYRNLFQLLTNEQVRFVDFQDYQKEEIDYLITNNYLFIDKDNVVRLNKSDVIYVIAILHLEDVLSFWHYPLAVREVILEMEKNGLVKFDNKLFTIEERKYLNFHLNQKEFTNGLDLRNKYMHGTNSSSEEQQQQDYHALLKLLILIACKLYDDLVIDKFVNRRSN